MTLLKEGLIILVLLLVPSVAGMLIVRRLAPSAFRDANRESADPVWAIAGGAFGLLLGFMVVILWDGLQDAQATVQDEASDIVNLYNLTFGLPDVADPQGLREQIKGYTQLLVDEEWPALGRHESSERAEARLDALWLSYMRLQSGGEATANPAYEESVARLTQLQEARNERINAAAGRVPTALWVVLIGGTALVIGMAWFTGADDFRTHLLTTAVLAISLAAILFLIRVFNNPFQGVVRADPEPMERALAHMNER